VDWTITPGDYQIYVQEVSQNGCAGDTVRRYIRVEGPELDLGGDTYVCDGETFSITPEGDFSAYLWSDGSTGSSYSTTEEGTIGLVVSDEYGCMDVDSLFLMVQLLPEVDLGNDTFQCGDAAMILDAGPDGIIYTWSTGEITQTINVYQGPIQDYWVEVEDAFGCKSQDTVTVDDCNAEFYFRDIPTAITPNGDGSNDVWIIKKLSAYSRSVVEIFDRWGTLVWRSEPGYSIPWDGLNMRGKEMPMDSYHFVIKLNTGDNEAVTGVITVIK